MELPHSQDRVRISLHLIRGRPVLVHAIPHVSWRSREKVKQRIVRELMKFQRICLPYLIIVAVVMSIYSVFLVHLTKSPFGPSTPTKPMEAETPSCVCTPESVEGLKAGRQVVMRLNLPYRYFDSNHWFHMSEYYVSRHAEVAQMLPKNGTIYIVAPHEVFVSKLIPMTFFLLLLAFTDGTSRRAEVLPRSAVARHTIAEYLYALDTTAEIVYALDTTEVESYVYDSSLPVFQRTRRYMPGERSPLGRSRMLVELYGDPESDNYAGSAGDMAMPVETAAAGTPPDGISAERVFVERFKGYVEKDGPQRPLLSEWWGAPNSRNLKEGTGVEFFPLSTATAPSLRPCACARFIADVGPAPKERGYWFNQEKVEDVRARIDALCGDIYRRWRHGYSPETEGQGQGLGGATRSSMSEDPRARFGGNSRKRLVIYQRDNDRQLLSLEDVVRMLGELLGSKWELVPIVHDNSHEPCWLYSQLMDADMLLTPHGFQSILLLFLPPGATILEVFPYKYWKEGYAPLAREWKVQHEYIMSRPVSWAKRLVLFFIPLECCMKSITCRKWSRGADVRLEEHHMRKIARAAKEASNRRREYLVPPATVAPGSSDRRRR